MVDQADNREQTSRRKPLLHRPKAVGIASGGNHQQMIGRQAQIVQTRPVKSAELKRIPLSLTPEHQTSVLRLAAQKKGNQGKREISN